jgi:hypothetical protein
MWNRVRFTLSEAIDDFRPIEWPVLGPYWCTGHVANSDFSKYLPIIVAYWPSDKLDELRKFWPEFKGEFDFVEEKETITFSDRFPKPDYWDAENNKFDEAYL